MSKKNSYHFQQYLEDKESMGFVRVLHAVPDAPNVDVYANDTLIFDNIAYTDVTEYMPIPEGRYKITVYVTDTKNSPILNNMLTVNAGTYLTVGAVGMLDSIGLAGIVDADMMVMPDRSMVRFAHLSPNAPAVDITLPNGTVVFDDISFKQITPYLDMLPMEYSLQVRVAGTDQVVLTIPNIETEAGKFYTIYAIGLVEDEPLLEALVITDGE